MTSSNLVWKVLMQLVIDASVICKEEGNWELRTCQLPSSEALLGWVTLDTREKLEKAQTHGLQCTGHLCSTDMWASLLGICSKDNTSFEIIAMPAVICANARDGRLVWPGIIACVHTGLLPREPLPHAKQVYTEGQAALCVCWTGTTGTCLALRIFLSFTHVFNTDLLVFLALLVAFLISGCRSFLIHSVLPVFIVTCLACSPHSHYIFASWRVVLNLLSSVGNCPVARSFFLSFYDFIVAFNFFKL